MTNNERGMRAVSRVWSNERVQNGEEVSGQLHVPAALTPGKGPPVPIG
jgi:hypothetical protein